MQFSVHSRGDWAVSLPKVISRVVSVGGRAILIAGLLTTSLFTGFKKLGVLESLELSSFDYLVRLQPVAMPDSRMLIVGMTEADIQQFGWPLSSETLAEILGKLQQEQPGVIGLDLYRSYLNQAESPELLEQLSADNLVAVMNVGSDPVMGDVPPPPTVPWERVGFNDLVIDPDGVLRRSLLFVDAPNQPYYSFATRVALAFLSQSNPSPNFQYDSHTLSIGSGTIRVLERGSGGYQTLDDQGYQTLLRFRPSYEPARQITVSQVLSGSFDPAWVRGKAVLIGTTAPSLKDQFYTPYSRNESVEFTMSGVMVHAHIVSQLLDVAAGEPVEYRFLPEWGETMWLWVWTLVAGVTVWTVHRPVFIFCAGGLLIAGLWSIGWMGLTHLIWVPIAEPSAGILVAGGLVLTQKLLHRSTHDALTGLPGREMFIQHVRRALQSVHRLRTAAPVTVAFLDIDRFKLINQSLGHAAGDRVLRTVVERLEQKIPPSTKLARVGGDEFALLFWQPRDEVDRILNSLQGVLSEPLCLNDQRLSVTASVGIAISQAGYNHTPEDLLRDAHTAMYKAKALGKFRYEVFGSGMLTEAVNRLKLESDLLSALDNQEFLLYYQPIICLKTGRITGFEALVRWQREAQGFVLPGAFIPVAEETGLIMPVGQWVFQAACQQLKIWQQDFPDQPLKMNINLSKRQFEQPDLVQQIETTLHTIGVSGQSIRIEITESTVMEDVDAAIDIMLQLKSLGLQLSIDDFGTGYSSLSYLHRFPMDTLKVDKSFVGRMEQSSEDREIVHTIIALGHNLGMDVVAEGIEQEQQMIMLRQANCESGQGYFFSRPVSSADATALLQQQPNW